MNVDRVSLGADEYLSHTQILTYVEDALIQLLEHTEYSRAWIPRFFAEYFNSVRLGNHILFREFSFIKATQYNRASFLRIFWRCFRQIGKNGDLLTVKEYHSLLQLLCPDFPMDLTQKAARIVLMDDAMDCLMSFVDFLYAFQIQFYYYEFLEGVAIIYQDLLMGKNPNTVIVPTSSMQEDHSLPSSEMPTQEGIDASQFYDCLETLCDRYKHSYPPASYIKDVLCKLQRVTFYGFLMALAKDDGINCKLGILPIKTELLSNPGNDHELEKVITQMLSKPASNSSSPQKEQGRKVTYRKPLAYRKKMDVESDGSTEETDSSDN